MNKISVIVPVYNVEKYLNQCVDSILRQDYNNIEIILVDDGSTDACGKICDEYAMQDKRVKVLHQNNKGLYMARKVGLELATGAYVTFVDSDDFVLSKAYSLSVKDMESDVDIIMFDIVRYYNDDVIVREKVNLEYGFYDRDNILKRMFPKMIWDFSNNTWGIDPSLCSKIFKKDIIKKAYMAADLNIYFGEDTAVVYYAIYLSNCVNIVNENYYRHRQRLNIIPPYVLKDDFFDNLYKVYRHLKDILTDKIFSRQIEGYYLHSLNVRKLILPLAETTKDIFPFNKVERDKNVVIYGAGKIGNIYMYQISKLEYCNNTYWVDKQFDKYLDKKVLPVEIIKNINFDYIVIALQSDLACKDVKKYLIDMGITSNKIVI